MIAVILAIWFSFTFMVSGLGAISTDFHTYSGNMALETARVIGVSAQNVIQSDSYEVYPPPTDSPPPTPYSLSGLSLPSGWTVSFEVQNAVPGNNPLWSTNYSDDGLQEISVTVSGPGLDKPYVLSFMKDRRTG